MKRLFLMLSLAAGVILPLAGAGAADKDHLLSTLTSGSNESQAMALILTRHYLQQGGSAQVLLCDAAAELALEGSDAGSQVVEPAGASPRQMLGALLEAGVPVQVCAIFLPNREETESDLRDGISVARPVDIAEVMARPGTRLFNN
ncbi:MAG: hypothetical protein JJU06_14550 [Ectothiorhodospiraceae bacterium]|nr:hypothetical protein [Ectothiorhodospiraceae bacterium]MCH8506702.1 hypothetical protein [Ectothiorhodospiraceae bacterium]